MPVVPSAICDLESEATAKALGSRRPCCLTCSCNLAMVAFASASWDAKSWLPLPELGLPNWGLALRVGSPVDGRPSSLGSDLETGPTGRVPGSSDGVGEVYGGGDERDGSSLNLLLVSYPILFRDWVHESEPHK